MRATDYARKLKKNTMGIQRTVVVAESSRGVAAAAAIKPHKDPRRRLLVPKPAIESRQH
jgi:hypothetical protein